MSFSYRQYQITSFGSLAHLQRNLENVYRTIEMQRSENGSLSSIARHFYIFWEVLKNDGETVVFLNIDPVTLGRWGSHRSVLESCFVDMWYRGIFRNRI